MAAATKKKDPKDPSTWPPSDRRRALRRPLIVLKVKLENHTRTFFGYAKNISRSGMFIASVNPERPGSQYQVEIPLPEPIRRTVVCQCQVVWSREYARGQPSEPGMGLRFLDMPADVAEAIDLWARTPTDPPPA
ncbi:MAG TPA: PilZ domain-containing protein [Myxococcota bacterium]|nr:PilZ domain-containing protein [Myxococcota bacterium]HRY93720.1 PilZ domain-containing protein [Myxococcota bacterium]HSA21931.1 PilZ domain-containing protein [Myxococcota bacterium]